jgi:ergothioneine biosynthesis protein EgtB
MSLHGVFNFKKTKICFEFNKVMHLRHHFKPNLFKIFSMSTLNVYQSAYAKVRKETESLCQPLTPEDYVVQASDFASPPKWNLGHTTWFFETFILKPNVADYKTYNDAFNFLYNSYYESIGKRTLRHLRGTITRPTTDEVYAYRGYVDAAMNAFLANPMVLEQSSELKYLFELGLHHEQQHQELFLTDVKYALSCNPLNPAYQTVMPPAAASPVLPLNYLPVEEGVYTIGHEGDAFHFDNEKGVHKTYLHAFQIANRPITNGEYIEFIKAGGYQKFQYWLSAGWNWVKTNQIDSPMYWQEDGGEWYQFTLYGLRKVDENEAVTHVSFYEADAFAHWSGKRLATEFEWEVACRQYSPQVPETGHFTDSGRYHPIAPTQDFQFFGNVWEWTNSAYLAYPFYTQAEGAIGEYNGKFMNNQMVLRGGSCATPRSHIRLTYRNFFNSHERWQFTGIRLAAYL